MLLWLESQPTAVIVLLVFAICYVLAAIVFFAVKTISRRPIAEQLNATTPVMLTPLAVIAGLLIAFLASRVWSNLDRATTYVAQEASAIRQSVLLSDALPDDTRTAAVPPIHRDGRLAGDGAGSREFAADTCRPPGCNEGVIVFQSRNT
jgi:hypothetical protein